MKTKDQHYHRESVILGPRVVLKDTSESGSQDLLVQEEQAHLGNRNKMRRATEKPELQDARRQNNVTKLMEMFEKQQHKEQLFEDMSQKQEINRFSEESQKLLADMNQTEIFEFCENSAKHQCLDCNAFSEVGIIHCSRGRHLKYSRSLTTLQRTNCDFTSIFGFVTKKNSSRPKHGVKVMFYKAKQMLKKARQKKHGNHPTIFTRWYEQ